MVKTVCILIIIAISWSTCSADEPSATIIKKVKMSIVLVECFPSPQILKAISGTSGTAFFINTDGYFVTAGHVIEAMKSTNPKCAAAMVIPQGDEESHNASAQRPIYPFEPATCIDDTRDDIAVCRTTENPFFNPLVKDDIAAIVFESAQPPDGTDVAFTGFPTGYGWPVTARATVATSTPVNSLPTITIDRLTWHGMSGAPLFTASGSVIGVMLGGGVGDDAGLSVARPTRVITDLLRQHTIPYNETAK